jgi:hypothetical protein
MRRVRAASVAVGKQRVLHNLSMCICSFSSPACNAHAPYFHLWPSPLYHIFPHYLINGTSFEKKLLNTKCVFWFSIQLLSETFLILRRNERDMIKKCNVFHVKYRLFLSDFNETWIFSTVFRNILKYKISWKCVKWEPSCSIRTGRTHRRTDTTKLIVAFGNFANTPKKWWNVQGFQKRQFQKLQH